MVLKHLQVKTGQYANNIVQFALSCFLTRKKRGLVWNLKNIQNWH